MNLQNSFCKSILQIVDFAIAFRVDFANVFATFCKSIVEIVDFANAFEYDLQMHFENAYGMARISRLLKIKGFFCRISSLL